MKNILSKIILVVIVFGFNEVFAKEVRTITLYGKFDPRLYASVITTYRSMDPSDIRKNYEECTKSNFNTGNRGRTLNFDSVTIKPDKDGNYKVSIPIDFEGGVDCGWEYVDTELTIRRDKRDHQYVKIILASSKQKAISNHKGSHNGSQQGGVVLLLETNDPKKPIRLGNTTTKKHFQISSGSKIECHTNWFTKSHRTGKPASVDFECIPYSSNNINGVDKLETTTINLDIEVNDKKCGLIQRGTRGGGIPLYPFIDYNPKTDGDITKKKEKNFLVPPLLRCNAYIQPKQVPSRERWNEK
jgi:hypothetical protein